MRSLIKSTFFQLAIIISALVLFQACGDSPTRHRLVYTPPAPYDISKADSSYTTDDGLQIYIIEEGYGPYTVTSRDRLSAYYTGRIIKNGEIGEVFESTYRNGSASPGILRNLTPTPISSSSGRTISPLIEGFRRGLIGMKEGEKRVIVIPPSLGYGDSQKGTNGFDLRNDTLRFDVKIDAIL